MNKKRKIDFAPSVYEHAAALIEKTPWQVSRSSELLFQAHATAFKFYGHAPVVVGIDIYNLEAEAYGAKIDKPKDNGIPSVSGHPCSEVNGIERLVPIDPEKDGRLPMVITVGERLAGEFPSADIRIPVSGPFSIASNLVGFDQLLSTIIDEPESVRKGLFILAEGQLAFCREIISRGLGIAFFESGATPPLISPSMFEQIEMPPLKFMIAEASAIAGRPIPCVIGGNTMPILESLLKTGTGYVICPCETDQSGFLKKMCKYPDVMVRINTNSGVFASGYEAAVYSELDRVIALADQRERVCIGTGALPFETNPDLVLKAKAYILEALSI